MGFQGVRGVQGGSLRAYRVYRVFIGCMVMMCRRMGTDTVKSCTRHRWPPGPCTGSAVLPRGALSPSCPGCLTLPFPPPSSQVAKTLDKLEVAYWRKEPVKTADKAASNHGISAMKFQLIKVLGGGRRGRGRERKTHRRAGWLECRVRDERAPDCNVQPHDSKYRPHMHGHPDSPPLPSSRTARILCAQNPHPEEPATVGVSPPPPPLPRRSFFCSTCRCFCPTLTS